MTLQIASGKEVLISEADFGLVSQFLWHVGAKGYVMARLNGKKIYLHRLIMNTPNDMDTDHINRNKLDNRRENLRIATRSENNMNKKMQTNNTSGYKGVGWNKQNQNWRAKIKVGDKHLNLGSFQDKILAAKAYDDAAKKYFGKYARTNF